MVNLIWVFLTVIGLVYAMFNGTMHEVNEAVFKGSKEAVTISIGLISVLVFWLGLMKIAEEAGCYISLVNYAGPLSQNYFLRFLRIIQRWGIFYPISWRIFWPWECCHTTWD